MREGKNWHIDDADSVTALVLEEGMVEIGRDWCAYLKGIQSLELPRSLKRIGNCAFEDCAGLPSPMMFR